MMPKLLIFIFFTFHLNLNAQNLYESEKIYIHTDRDLYYENDTLWAKFFLFNATNHVLSNSSKIAYVSILDSANNILYKSKIKILNSQADFFIVLPNCPNSSYYRLVAHTNLMSNYDVNLQFQKKINIVKNEKIVNISTKEDFQNSLHFFPEGGDLISDNVTRVGIKCTLKNGRGFNISGHIFDESKNLICDFSTSHLGIGSFLFTPNVNHSYFARYEIEGRVFRVDLPRIFAKGYSLKVDYLGQKKGLLTQINSNIINQKKLTLRIHQRGKILLNEDLKDNKKVHKFLFKDSISDGIVHVTIFNDELNPVAERLVFINNNSNTLLIKNNFKQKAIEPLEKINFDIEISTNQSVAVKDAIVSIAILDADQLNIDSQNPNMNNYLLLNSDLKGWIEDPGSYFNMTTKRESYFMDNLMLTQGWRRFNNSNKVNFELNFEIEKGLFLSGIAFKNKKEVKNEPIYLNIWDDTGLSIKTINTNEKGEYYLEGNWKGEIQILALDKKGKELTLIQNEVYFGKPENLFLLENQINSFTQLIKQPKNWGENNAINLEEVVIKGKKLNLLRNDSRRSLYSGQPDLTLEITTEMTSGVSDIAQLLEGRIVGISPGSLSNNSNEGIPQSTFGDNISPTGGSISSVPPPAGSSAIASQGASVSGEIGQIGKTILILVDGVRIPASFLKSIPVNMVERVDLLRDVAKTSMYGLDAGAGKVINILTKKHSDALNSLNSKYLAKNNGFNVRREFYNPKYNFKETPKDFIDYRSTVYWNPNVKGNSNGIANIEFFNSSIAKKLLISVETTDKIGNIGSAIFYIGD
jgi:hypothetical protein